MALKSSIISVEWLRCLKQVKESRSTE